MIDPTCGTGEATVLYLAEADRCGYPFGPK